MVLEAAGCIAVEMECVPAEVAAELTERTTVLVFFMGRGHDCDGQFIFTEDILGSHNVHYQQHTTTYKSLYNDDVAGSK